MKLRVDISRIGIEQCAVRITQKLADVSFYLLLLGAIGPIDGDLQRLYLYFLFGRLVKSRVLWQKKLLQDDNRGIVEVTPETFGVVTYGYQ